MEHPVRTHELNLFIVNTVVAAALLAVAVGLGLERLLATSPAPPTLRLGAAFFAGFLVLYPAVSVYNRQRGGRLDLWRFVLGGLVGALIMTLVKAIL